MFKSVKCFFVLVKELMGSEKPINRAREIKINGDFKNHECTPVPTVHLLSIICVVYTLINPVWFS